MQASAPIRKTVFISYSRADLAAVRGLALELRHAGLDTWLDLDDLVPGQKWKEAISTALACADAMVFCVSALSLESAWTSVELAKARALGLPVVPVAIGPVDLSALPEALRERQVLDMGRHPPTVAAALTARQVAAALGVAPPAPPAWAGDGPARSLPGGLADGHADGHPDGHALVDVIAIAMDRAPLPSAAVSAALSAAIACHGRVEYLDFSCAALVRLADVVAWAGRARRAILIVGPSADPVLVGLVMGTLCLAFGNQRFQMLAHGEATHRMTSPARIAGIALHPM